MYFGHFIRVKAYIAFGENAQSSTSSACQSPVHMHGLSTQILKMAGKILSPLSVQLKPHSNLLYNSFSNRW